MTAPRWAEDSWHMCFEAVGDRPPYGECALVRAHDGPHLDRPRPYRGWDVDPLTVEPVEGWETARRRSVDRPVVDRGAIVWTTSAFLVLIAIVWFIAINLLSAPRSSPDPTAVPSSLAGPTAGAGDPAASTVGASGQSSSGAPSAHSHPAVALAARVDTARLDASRPEGAPTTAAIGTAAGAMKGRATYFPTCAACAAASGELQAAIGPGWKGTVIEVRRGSGVPVRLRLITGCGCSPRPSGWFPIVDLSEQAFRSLLTPAERKLGIAAKGVIKVVVTWGEFPTPTAPATDTEEAIR